MSEAGCQRKKLWPIVKYHPGICLETMEKQKDTSHDCQHLARIQTVNLSNLS
jgi:hypothetical protein